VCVCVCVSVFVCVCVYVCVSEGSDEGSFSMSGGYECVYVFVDKHVCMYACT
jgi:hypothetical protein